MSLERGSVVRVPLTTPQRRLGTLGIASRAGITYSTEEIEVLGRIARVVALAIDDAPNLRKAQQAEVSTRSSTPDPSNRGYELHDRAVS